MFMFHYATLHNHCSVLFLPFFPAQPPLSLQHTFLPLRIQDSHAFSALPSTRHSQDPPEAPFYQDVDGLALLPCLEGFTF